MGKKINAGSIEWGVNVKTGDMSGFKSIEKNLKSLKDLAPSDLMAQGMKGSSSDLEKKIQQAQKSATELEGALKKAFNPDLKTINFDKLNQSLKNLDIGKIFTDLNNVGVVGKNVFNSLTSSMVKTRLEAKKTKTIFDEIGEGLIKTASWSVYSSITNTMLGSLSKAVDYTKELDTNLNAIRVVTKKSAEDMDAFAQRANAAAKNLGISTNEYTKGALTFYQQGLNDEDVQTRTNISAKIANVTQQSGELSSQQLTAIANSFKLSANEIEPAMDKIAAVAASSATSFAEVASAMQKVASAAATTGVSVGSLTSMIATVSETTREAPESIGTAFKTLFARMEDFKAAGTDEFGTTLGQVSSQLDTMGVHILDQTGQLKTMDEVMADLAAHWGGWNEQQKIAAAQAAGGKRQYVQLMALMDNWDRYQELMGVAGNATGELQKQQDIVMESAEAKIQKMSTSFEGVIQSLFDADTLKVFADSLSAVADSIKFIVDSLGGGKAVFTLLLSLITKLGSQEITKQIANLSKNLKMMKEAKIQDSLQVQGFNSIIRQLSTTANVPKGDIQRLERIRDVLKNSRGFSAENRQNLGEAFEVQTNLLNQKNTLEQKKKQSNEWYNNRFGRGGQKIDLFDEKNVQKAKEFEEALKGAAKAQKEIRANINKIGVDLSKNTNLANTLNKKAIGKVVKTLNTPDTSYNDWETKTFIPFSNQMIKGAKEAFGSKYGGFKNISSLAIPKSEIEKLENEYLKAVSKIGRQIEEWIEDAVTGSEKDMEAIAESLESNIVEMIKEFQDNFEGQLGVALEQAEANIKEMTPSVKEAKEKGKEVDEGIENTERVVEEVEKDAKTQEKIQSFVELSSAAMGAVTSIQMISSSIENFGERPMETLMGIGMSITSIIPLCNQLKVALAEVGIAMSATGIGAIIVAIGAAIGVATKMFNDWQENIKKAGEELSRVNENSRQLDTTISKIEELNKIKKDQKSTEEDIVKANEEIAQIEDELLEKYKDVEGAYWKIKSAIDGNVDSLRELQKEQSLQVLNSKEARDLKNAKGWDEVTSGYGARAFDYGWQADRTGAGPLGLLGLLNLNSAGWDNLRESFGGSEKSIQERQVQIGESLKEAEDRLTKKLNKLEEDGKQGTTEYRQIKRSIEGLQEQRGEFLTAERRQQRADLVQADLLSGGKSINSLKFDPKIYSGIEDLSSQMSKIAQTTDPTEQKALMREYLGTEEQLLSFLNEVNPEYREELEEFIRNIKELNSTTSKIYEEVAGSEDETWTKEDIIKRYGEEEGNKIVNKIVALQKDPNAKVSYSTVEMARADIFDPEKMQEVFKGWTETSLAEVGKEEIHKKLISLTKDMSDEQLKSALIAFGIKESTVKELGVEGRRDALRNYLYSEGIMKNVSDDHIRRIYTAATGNKETFVRNRSDIQFLLGEYQSSLGQDNPLTKQLQAVEAIFNDMELLGMDFSTYKEKLEPKMAGKEETKLLNEENGEDYADAIGYLSGYFNKDREVIAAWINQNKEGVQDLLNDTTGLVKKYQEMHPEEALNIEDVKTYFSIADKEFSGYIQDATQANQMLDSLIKGFSQVNELGLKSEFKNGKAVLDYNDKRVETLRQAQGGAYQKAINLINGKWEIDEASFNEVQKELIDMAQQCFALGFRPPEGSDAAKFITDFKSSLSTLYKSLGDDSWVKGKIKKTIEETLGEVEITNDNIDELLNKVGEQAPDKLRDLFGSETIKNTIKEELGDSTLGALEGAFQAFLDWLNTVLSFVGINVKDSLGKLNTEVTAKVVEWTNKYEKDIKKVEKDLEEADKKLNKVKSKFDKSLTDYDFASARSYGQQYIQRYEEKRGAAQRKSSKLAEVQKNDLAILKANAISGGEFDESIYRDTGSATLAIAERRRALETKLNNTTDEKQKVGIQNTLNTLIGSAEEIDQVNSSLNQTNEELEAMQSNAEIQIEVKLNIANAGKQYVDFLNGLYEGSLGQGSFFKDNRYNSLILGNKDFINPNTGKSFTKQELDSMSETEIQEAFNQGAIKPFKDILNDSNATLGQKVEAMQTIDAAEKANIERKYKIENEILDRQEKLIDRELSEIDKKLGRDSITKEEAQALYTQKGEDLNKQIKGYQDRYMSNIRRIEDLKKKSGGIITPEVQALIDENATLHEKAEDNRYELENFEYNTKKEIYEKYDKPVLEREEKNLEQRKSILQEQLNREDLTLAQRKILYEQQKEVELNSAENLRKRIISMKELMATLADNDPRKLDLQWQIEDTQIDVEKAEIRAKKLEIDEAKDYVNRAIASETEQEKTLKELLESQLQPLRDEIELRNDLIDQEKYQLELKKKEIDKEKKLLEERKKALQQLLKDYQKKWKLEDEDKKRQEALENRQEKVEERSKQLTAAAQGDLEALSSVEDLDKEIEEIDAQLLEDLISDVRQAIEDGINNAIEAIDNQKDALDKSLEKWNESITLQEEGVKALQQTLKQAETQLKYYLRSEEFFKAAHSLSREQIAEMKRQTELLKDGIISKEDEKNIADSIAKVVPDLSDTVYKESLKKVNNTFDDKGNEVDVKDYDLTKANADLSKINGINIFDKSITDPDEIRKIYEANKGLKVTKYSQSYSNENGGYSYSWSGGRGVGGLNGFLSADLRRQEAIAANNLKTTERRKLAEEKKSEGSNIGGVEVNPKYKKYAIPKVGVQALTSAWAKEREEQRKLAGEQQIPQEQVKEESPIEEVVSSNLEGISKTLQEDINNSIAENLAQLEEIRSLVKEIKPQVDQVFNFESLINVQGDMLEREVKKVNVEMGVNNMLSAMGKIFSSKGINLPTEVTG